jgi:hypothetical protein
MNTSQLAKFQEESCSQCAHEEDCFILGTIAAEGKCKLVTERSGEYSCRMFLSCESTFDFDRWIVEPRTEDVEEVLAKIEESYHQF